MTSDPSVRDRILATVPSLRAFAISLCGSVDRADDLVQETMLRYAILRAVLRGKLGVAWDEREQDWRFISGERLHPDRRYATSSDTGTGGD